MLKPRLLATVCTLLVACLSAGAAASYSLDLAEVREVLSRAMRCQALQQVHAAVVHRDTELYSFGLELLPSGEVRDINDTKLLYLASVSKGMFGTALMRVEQHLRDVTKNESFSLFKTPVKHLLGDSSFWFLDHGRSELVTIDDFLSHRTGLARHDAMWYLYEWESKQQLAEHVGRLKASADFRNSLLYNNLVWTLADVIVQQLTNRTFVEYMREFLWQPLSMSDTHGASEMKEKRLLERLDISRYHKPLGMPLDMSKMEQATRFVEAAGGILSPLQDMVSYMKLHASHNYSAYLPAPGQFRPLNALAAESDINIFFNPQLYRDDVSPNLPDWEVESYGRGWMRTWHRNHLDYSHGGSLLGVRCELDIFAKQNLAVFNHMTLGPPDGAPLQSLYSAIVNKYIAELLLFNQSFVNRDNVCQLLKNTSDTSVVTIPRRELLEDEIDALVGSYGNYGFGSVDLSFNQSSATMTLRYGIAVIELIPITLRQASLPYFFLLNLLEPKESANSDAILNITDAAVQVPGSTYQNPMAFLTVNRDPADETRLVMESAALEAGMQLIRGLDPGTWKRPELCPDGGGGPNSATPLGLSGAATTAAAALLARVVASFLS